MGDPWGGNVATGLMVQFLEGSGCWQSILHRELGLFGARVHFGNGVGVCDRQGASSAPLRSLRH